MKNGSTRARRIYENTFMGRRPTRIVVEYEYVVKSIRTTRIRFRHYNAIV